MEEVVQLLGYKLYLSNRVWSSCHPRDTRKHSADNGGYFFRDLLRRLSSATSRSFFFKDRLSCFFAFLSSSASGSTSNFVTGSKVLGLWGGEGLTFSMVTPIPKNYLGFQLAILILWYKYNLASLTLQQVQILGLFCAWYVL